MYSGKVLLSVYVRPATDILTSKITSQQVHFIWNRNTTSNSQNSSQLQSTCT